MTTFQPTPGLEPDVSMFPGFAEIAMERQSHALTLASFLVWAWSGRRFGLTRVKVRPVRTTRPLPTNVPTYPYGAWLTSGIALGAVLCGCLGPVCGCHGRRQVTLLGPVDSVTEVKIDGAVLDPSSYRPDEGRYLVRTDGSDWPWQQAITKPDTEVGTWAITYMRGERLPAAGAQAAGALAWKLAQAEDADDNSGLPERIAQLTRQGIDVQFVQPDTFIDDGKTGVLEVDRWLAAVNPHKLDSNADVWSPDLATNQHRYVL